MASLIPRPVRALLILVAIVLGISLAWVWELRRHASAGAPPTALPVLADTVPFAFPDASGAPLTARTSPAASGLPTCSSQPAHPFARC